MAIPSSFFGFAILVFAVGLSNGNPCLSTRWQKFPLLDKGQKELVCRGKETLVSMKGKILAFVEYVT
ncbi:MAG: hypothetical protein JRF33_24165 [Deltaproteobacteria bacterium]|nr:hypothetical protein [Deltaproteobacteria bacterium]